jgi:hypothetical protein
MVEVRKVFQVAGREVVDANNRVAFAQQAVSKMRTKKSGSAGNKYAHGHE